MVGKSKEDGKIEKVLRGLLKLPENRRCINCNSLGPQYVCTTFWTFVCTNCSGAHREFTHRVKSVSMATFSVEEVNALQAGGNERAQQIYFKTWDPACHIFPDSSNIHGLRDFIKHVYVDRRFTGETPPDKLPRLRLSDKEYNEHRDINTISERYSSRGRKVDRNIRNSYNEANSPSYFKETSRSGVFKKGNPRFDKVDDRSLDYDPAVLRRSATQMFTTEDIKPRRESPVPQKDRNVPCLPPVHPMRELLGENAPALRVVNQTKSGERTTAGGSAHMQAGEYSQSSNQIADAAANPQRVAISSSQTSGDENAEKHSCGNSESLIDFATEPAPSDASVQRNTQQMSASLESGKLASSEPSKKEMDSNLPNRNTLEFLMFELSNTAGVPAGNQPGAISREDTPAAAPLGNVPSLPTSGDREQFSTMQQLQLSTISIPESSSPAQKTTGFSGLANSQPAALSLEANTQESLCYSAVLSSLSAGGPVQDTNISVRTQPSLIESNSTGRKALPADLFTSPYQSGPTSFPGWQTDLHYNMGYNMQYHPASMQAPAFLNAAKPRNPFDFNDEITQGYNNTFPSLASWQGAFPHLAAPAAILNSSFVPHPSGAFEPDCVVHIWRQHSHGNMLHSRPQGQGGFGSNGERFGSSDSNQQPAYGYLPPTNPSSFPTRGGNPFG
ncbi:hypothetical protein Nepgr_013709 [Nepenthes gracilis]|uniref:Arf-GAP domain-containing protein n=1 Tax=Nepenthes gracilis TaxID=150966 RepID=A0AAD3SIB6_NEPGR|nr:hypothetical protein Nepgr_013709 [Nepenthes gracilis]